MLPSGVKRSSTAATKRVATSPKIFDKLLDKCPKVEYNTHMKNIPLTDLTLDQMRVLISTFGVDPEIHSELIEEMYWDGHSPFEIKQQIEVFEGDCSI